MKRRLSRAKRNIRRRLIAALRREIREKLRAFGRSRGMAWYYLGGAKHLKRQRRRSRIVHWERHA